MSKATKSGKKSKAKKEEDAKNTSADKSYADDDDSFDDYHMTADFDVENNTQIAAPAKPRSRTSKARAGRPAGGNKNEIIKSRLSLIIDMLSSDGEDFNDQTIKRNVSICVKHLKELLEML